jgi:hypothetical protein
MSSRRHDLHDELSAEAAVSGGKVDRPDLKETRTVVIGYYSGSHLARFLERRRPQQAEWHLGEGAGLCVQCVLAEDVR